ncbi:ADP-ribosylglycohydrolase [Singulisphaera sp. GP187]|uniref:ADP-ribosylglycohydrolase family protein n=1 Tax=Singulisphaera sp. GP187 TaxID=1882752 RepID=UPI00092596B3|nr:ADP-ribosylglycohydrolase family protein [Singulisphaera sp. GP187]SIO33878.1 ADP-ribosylglycohydrolase [Singulisphaera sp. GP187]
MTESQPDLQSRFLGCLVGCAVGDALGAPFEGYWEHQLPGRTALLRGFAEVDGYPRGQYTDDTQLTLATVESIVGQGGVEPADIARRIAALWKSSSVVGPGGACTFAAHAFLKTRDWTSCGAPVGQAGNGTAMRTAALGLAFLRDPERLPEAVANVSRITHQDPRSVAGGIAIAKAAQLLATPDPVDQGSFCGAIAGAIRPYEATFASLIEDLPLRLQEDRETAFYAIAWAGSAKPEFSRPVITPFVVPTVLAALWVVLQHRSSWPDAVAAAIQLGGDVDTLGAIVGALMGIRLGITAIPAHLAEGVLRSNSIRLLAEQYFLTVAAMAGD